MYGTLMVQPCHSLIPGGGHNEGSCNAGTTLRTLLLDYQVTMHIIIVSMKSINFYVLIHQNSNNVYPFFSTDGAGSEISS